MDVSIIIVNFKTDQLTQNCIDSIRNFTSGLHYEIIVIDNASKRHSDFPFANQPDQVTYIRNDENLGFGKANNIGMLVAIGRYLLLLNSDTILHENCILDCLLFMESEKARKENIAVLGCRLLNEDGSYQSSFYPFVKTNLGNYMISNNPLLYKLFKVKNKFKEIKDPKQVGDISGAFMFLRKKVVEEVQGFDPDFFLYCEETEWCRLRIAPRFKIWYYPLTSLTHLGGKSAPKNLMYLQSQLSLALFWYKKGWLSYILYILYTWFNGLYYIVTYPLVSKSQRAQVVEYLNGLRKIFPYLYNDIPRYKRAFGARKEGLILKEARSTFFNAESN